KKPLALSVMPYSSAKLDRFKILDTARTSQMHIEKSHLFKRKLRKLVRDPVAFTKDSYIFRSIFSPAQSPQPPMEHLPLSSAVDTKSEIPAVTIKEEAK